MKRVAFFLLFYLFFIGFVSSTMADTIPPRQTACDLCGYCPPNPTPANWPDCKRCIYPNASADATSGDTLRIVDLETNTPPTPAPGKQYTMLGCLGTNLGGFQQQGAAAGVVQQLLSVIFSIVGGIAFLTIIYGSFVIITSQANPERLNYGKKIVFGAIVGVIFAISSVFLINLLATGILRIPGFSSSTPTPTP